MYSGRLVCLLLLVLSLTACGFHPRGDMARPAAAISPVYISGLADSHPFMRELRHQLQLGGVALASAPDQAATVLRVQKLKAHRNVFSVNANNKAVEFEIVNNLRFSVEHPPGEKVIRNQELDARYIVYEPGGELLGRTREAEKRMQDTYRELAQRLITRLNRIPQQP